MPRPKARPALLRRLVVLVLTAVLVAVAVLSSATVANAGAAVSVERNRQQPEVARLGEFVAPVVVDRRAPTDDELVGFLDAVQRDLTATWARVLEARGVSPSARLALFHMAQISVLQTACGPVRSDIGPFFCGADVTIYLGLEFARAVWTYVGDMALVQVVAHEFGHGVQQLLGVVPTAGSPAYELQADCLGGAYAQDAAARGLLEPGDAEEARLLSRLVGDDGPSDDPHGSPDQREQAWQAGYAGGVPSCLVM